VDAQERTAVRQPDAPDRIRQGISHAIADQARTSMLISNEHALWEAVAKADKGSFPSLTLPEGVWTTRQGFVPTKLLVDGLQAFHLTKWDIVNPHVTWLDKDSAVLVYVWTGAGTYGDQPLASTTLASTVWTNRNGKWLAAHHQETDLIKN
jgi:hypothetical protein